jgi:hypothetical protein
MCLLLNRYHNTVVCYDYIISKINLDLEGKSLCVKILCSYVCPQMMSTLCIFNHPFIHGCGNDHLCAYKLG